MLNDRNYYRMLDDEDLIDAAKETDNELAIVLGERLRKARRKLEGYHYDELAERN